MVFRRIRNAIVARKAKQPNMQALTNELQHKTASLPSELQFKIASLPNELQSKIASYLSRPDLRNYRLANRKNADIGALHLFHTFEFNARSRTLERQNQFLQHGRLHKHVRQLAFRDVYGTAKGAVSAAVFADVIRNFMAAGCKIEDLEITFGEPLGSLSAYVQFLAEEAVLPHLRRFKMRIHGLFDEEMGDPDELQACSAMLTSGHLQTFLAKAKRLMAVSVRIPELYALGEPWLPLARLEHMAPLNAQATLRCFELENFCAREEELMQVITNHGSELETLHLINVHLAYGGSWKKVLRCVRKSCGKLADVTCKGLYWWKGDVTVENAELENVSQYLRDGTECDEFGLVDCDEEIAEAITKYLVNGGKWPLKKVGNSH
jgi:hypothetical protein